MNCISSFKTKSVSIKPFLYIYVERGSMIVGKNPSPNVCYTCKTSLIKIRLMIYEIETEAIVKNI